jgi:hypothetical protein
LPPISVNVTDNVIIKISQSFYGCQVIWGEFLSFIEALIKTVINLGGIYKLGV